MGGLLFYIRTSIPEFVHFLPLRCAKQNPSNLIFIYIYGKSLAWTPSVEKRAGFLKKCKSPLLWPYKDEQYRANQGLHVECGSPFSFISLTPVRNNYLCSMWSHSRTLCWWTGTGLYKLRQSWGSFLSIWVAKLQTNALFMMCVCGYMYLCMYIYT